MFKTKLKLTGKIITTLLIMIFFSLISIYEKSNINAFIEEGKNPIKLKTPQFKVDGFLKNKGIVFTNKNLFDDGTKLLLVHFWATWCGPCEEELPEFISFMKTLKDKKIKAVFIAVTDEDKKIKKFFKKLNIKDGEFSKNIILATDTEGTSMQAFATFRVPETYLLSSNGHIVKQFIGPQKWGKKEKETILSLIK